MIQDQPLHPFCGRAGASGPRDELFATVRAAMARHLRIPGTDTPLEPYPEQIAGARALLDGAIAEMATGEGKTITAAFAAAGWAREGPVHVATANAYLAARDAEWLRPVYQELGLSSGVVTPQMPRAERRRQYGCDVVYSTLAEFGFDYLRDRLVLRTADRVQARGLGALIVDEADLLLIDEARTPLVIARPSGEHAGPDLARLAHVVEELLAGQAERVRAKLDLPRGGGLRRFDATVLAAQVRRGAPRDPAVLDYFARNPAALRAVERVEHELRGPSAWMLDDGLLYSLDERSRTAFFTADGQAAVERQLGPVFELPEGSAETLAALHNLLLAYALFQRDRDYLVRDGRVVLIEEATGRAAESRRYMHGLHAAIEVKELGAPLEDSVTLAQISVQQLVRQYARRAGMTGTAMPAADEFLRAYDMPVVRIPRHRPNRRMDLPPRLYRSVAQADGAVADEVAAAHAIGRPVLVGTQDVRRSERLSALLRARGIRHAVLNAREHADEAVIVAGAGRLEAVTIATNMAGRGTDIRLQDGLEEMLLERAVQQVRERVAKGEVAVECASPHALSVLKAAITAESGLKAAVDQKARRVVVTRDEQKDATGPGPVRHPSSFILHPSDTGAGGGVLRFGLGLHVIAAEPGNSRRLDDQLRGRSGRQGDEGSTRLYASLEDDTLRFYGAPHLRARALRAMAGRPFIEGRDAARLTEDAQRRAESIHEGQRRELFEFDRVLEAQRMAMLGAYERALAHTAPDEAVHAFIPDVAAGELARRPADPARWPGWQAEIITRYGLPACNDLVGAMQERWQRMRMEAGDRWPEVVRAALLRTAAELWAVHIEQTDVLQRQAPALFAFLPGAATIPYAKEASSRYDEYLWQVKSETLSTLLTLPQRYERPLPPDRLVPVSAAVGQLLDCIERNGRGGAPGRPGA